MPQLNYDFTNTEDFNDPNSRRSIETSIVTGLGRMPSNSGNVEDFNDTNSDLSQGTAGLLNSMRMQREVHKKEDATPLSEKLLRIELANRQARQKAAMYIKERELNLKEDEMQYNRVKDAAALARAEADKEELRAKEKAKGELDYNTKRMEWFQNTGKTPTPETIAEFDSFMKPGQSVQPVQIVQTPQVQTGEIPKKTMGQQLGFWKDKEKEKAIKEGNLKLQEKIGYVFTPEEEQLPEIEKRNILLKKTTEGGGENLKDFQAKATVYVNRMEEANKIFDDLYSEGYNKAGIGNSLVSGTLNKIPFGIGESMKPENLKLQEQAERNFLNAVLRNESGAMITKEEFESGKKQYFPEVGDSKAVLEQKRQNRIMAIESMKKAYKINTESLKTGQQQPNAVTQNDNDPLGIL